MIDIPIRIKLSRVFINKLFLLFSMVYRSDLAIIARESDVVNNEYLTEGIYGNTKQNVNFTRPNGTEESLGGVYVVKSSWLNEFSMEYFAAEFTRDCNVSCKHCYVSAGSVDCDEPKYISLEFVSDIADKLKNGPIGRPRGICISGGEPTLDLKKLQTRYCIFNEVLNNKVIEIATNLLAIKCNDDAIGEFFSQFSDAIIQASYSPHLEEQYSRIAERISSPGYEKFKGHMPNILPGRTLREKIRLFDDFAHRHGRRFKIRVNGKDSEEMEEYKKRITEYIGFKGRDTSDIILAKRIVGVGRGRNIEGAATANDAQKKRCSQQEEIYMCSNGDLFPSINGIDNIENRIGTLVRLL